MLSPEVQRAFGGFAGWRKGYARTVSHAPGEVTVTPAGAGATVGLTLLAGDRGACGETVERRFAVTWRLAPTRRGLARHGRERAQDQRPRALLSRAL